MGKLQILKIHNAGGSINTTSIDMTEADTIISSMSAAASMKDAGLMFFANGSGSANISYASGHITSGWATAGSTTWNKGYIDFKTHAGNDTNWTTDMRIQGGNVGIGTTNPVGKLHISNGSTNPYDATGNYSFIAVGGASPDSANGFRSWCGFSNPSSGYGGFVISHSASYGSETFRANSTALLSVLREQQAIFFINTNEHIFMRPSRSEEFNTILNIQTTVNSRPTLMNFYNGGNQFEWVIGQKAHGMGAPFSTDNGSTFLFMTKVGTTHTTRLRIRPDATYAGTFTGQHRSFPLFYDKIKNKDEYNGLIVYAVGYHQNVNPNVEKNIDAITINESVPVVQLTNKEMDKSVFGIVSSMEDSNTRYDTFGSIETPSEKIKGDIRIFVNSLGEGAIWVSNTNGILQNGDYITSSSIEGYGMKQDGDLLYNYTVAKITMDCDFTQPLKAKQHIKKYKVIKTETVDVKETIDISNVIQEVIYDEESGKYVKKNTIQYTKETKDVTIDVALYDESGNEIGLHQINKKETITKEIEENVLDENGCLIWEDELDENGNVIMEPAYKVRYLLPDATQISKEEYEVRKANNQAVYIAAFVGCTYHCG